MPRALTAARAKVAPERVAEYLGLLRRLAARMRDRGEHLWVFRHSDEPGAFLEFSESRSVATHRIRAKRDAAERALEEALTTVAAYSPDSRVLWEEVFLEER